MRTLRVLTVFTLIALTACSWGCTSRFKDIRVDTLASPGADFSGHKTYAWAGSAAVVRDPHRQWTPPNLNIGSEITFLVDRKLRARGMTEVTDSPDMLVLFAVGVDMQSLDVVVDPEDGMARLKQVPQGGVMVVFIDPDSRRTIWVGGAVAELQEEPDLERAKERLDFAITTMLDDLPD